MHSVILDNDTAGQTDKNVSFSNLFSNSFKASINIKF